MKNKHAIALNEAAKKYSDWFKRSFSDDKDMLAGGKKDYQDLISIVQMIEAGEAEATIARSMSRLDTAVREVIPDAVYYHYVR
jgi:hypothetical protein